MSNPGIRNRTTMLTKRIMRRTSILMSLLCSLLLLGLSVRNFRGARSESPSGDLTTIQALLSLSSNAIAQADIARMNLLCAQGLAGLEGFDSNTCLTRLDEWADRVKSETERHLYRFRHHPNEFENSEGLFRMLMMAVVLAEDCKVHYAPERRLDASLMSLTSEQDGFFADANKVFLPGLLGPGREGTCSSLPVLYVAIGRRLGYPLKLVTTKGHLFVRWEGAGERFNVEAAGEGLNRFADDYYRSWPFPVTEEEVATEGYLKSLTPAEELAVFLSIRGLCLREAGRISEAVESFAAATRFASHWRSCKAMLVTLQRQQNESKSRKSVEIVKR